MSTGELLFHFVIIKLNKVSASQMENLTEVEKLYIRLLEARVDKLWYFYDTDEFINTSFDILDLCNIEDCLILGPPDRLAGSRVKLEPLLEELEEQKDELDARKILFHNLHVEYWQLREVSGYTSGSLNIWQGSCTITVTPSGPDYVITSEANVNEVINKYESNITINGNNITVNSWQRLTN